MEYRILDKINSPEDLKALPHKEIEPLCADIREFLVDKVEKNGGHLASNLGVCELTVALHRVFDSPKDKIIFDVGHQSYVHKIITGRRAEFDTLRKTGGLSGFTKISESEHDPFGAGHSSTSVSAALGFAEAERLRGTDGYTVAVLGDGAYTGGMVHEALNNCDPDLKLIIVLNENGMSISLNKGTFASYLSKVRISKGYMTWKKSTTSAINHIPLIGKPIMRFLTWFKKKLKNLIYSSNYFEDLGLYYIGPIDGNNYKKVEHALTEAKRTGKCVIVHVKTVKGKGYAPAEDSPGEFHSVYSGVSSGDSFHSHAASKLCEIAMEDKDTVAITAAMGIGTGLDRFEAEFADRYYDVGIAEEHALTFAGGLAAAGLKPFVAIYSTFLQRGYDNIVHDIALQNLPVKMLIDRAGLSVGDGATHHGIFDVAFLSHVPSITLLAPMSYDSLSRDIEFALASNSPVAIRYPNAKEPSDELRLLPYEYRDGIVCAKSSYTADNVPKRVFITYGSQLTRVFEAKGLIDGEVGVILLESLKPYSTLADLISPLLLGAERIVFAEEGIKSGGAAMLLREELLEHGFDFTDTEYIISAIDDSFASPTERCDLYSYVGLDGKSLAEKMKK